jgi:hypothetical protein
VVVNKQKNTNTATIVAPKKRIQPTRSRKKSSVASMPKEELIFGKQNYIFMGIGFGLIALGMILMSGGGMPNPDVWDDSIIYSFRRTVLAPFLMIAGLIVEVYAIFKK